MRIARTYDGRQRTEGRGPVHTVERGRRERDVRRVPELTIQVRTCRSHGAATGKPYVRTVGHVSHGL